MVFVHISTLTNGHLPRVQTVFSSTLKLSVFKTTSQVITHTTLSSGYLHKLFHLSYPCEQNKSHSWGQRVFNEGI